MGGERLGSRAGAEKQNLAVAGSAGSADDATMASRYLFLVDTYATEILKVLSVWAMATDKDTAVTVPEPFLDGMSTANASELREA